MVDIELPGLTGLERVELIGRGTSGSVFRSFQQRFDRWVAVKVLVQAIDAEAAERFARECRALGGLSGHPYVVPVYDAGFLTDGRPYLVMPFLGGGSLSDGVRARGPLPTETALEVGVKVASALDAAHGLGVLHRDVKPDNILLTQYGEPQLADFGIARLETASMTRTGTYAGTPLHAAPEVLAGGRATVSSDVYGLASTLYALVAGTAAFHSATDESIFPLLQRITSQPPPDLRARGLPDALATVIERGMAKTPAERPATARGFGLALQHAQQSLGLPVSAAPGLPAGGGAGGSGGSFVLGPDPAVLGVLTGQSPEEPVAASRPGPPTTPPPAAFAPAPGPGPAPSQPSQPSQPAASSRRPLLIGIGALVILLAVGGGAFALTRGSGPSSNGALPSGPHTYALDTSTPSTAVLAIGDGSPGVDVDVLFGSSQFALTPVGSATRAARRITLPLVAATVQTGGAGGLQASLTGADGAGLDLATMAGGGTHVSNDTLVLATAGAPAASGAAASPTTADTCNAYVVTSPALISAPSGQVHLTGTISLTQCGADSYGHFLGTTTFTVGARFASLDAVLHVTG